MCLDLGWVDLFKAECPGLLNLESCKDLRLQHHDFCGENRMMIYVSRMEEKLERNFYLTLLVSVC